MHLDKVVNKWNWKIFFKKAAFPRQETLEVTLWKGWKWVDFLSHNYMSAVVIVSPFTKEHSQTNQLGLFLCSDSGDPRTPPPSWEHVFSIIGFTFLWNFWLYGLEEKAKPGRAGGTLQPGCTGHAARLLTHRFHIPECPHSLKFICRIKINNRGAFTIICRQDQVEKTLNSQVPSWILNWCFAFCFSSQTELKQLFSHGQLNVMVFQLFVLYVATSAV